MQYDKMMRSFPFFFFLIGTNAPSSSISETQGDVVEPAESNITLSPKELQIKAGEESVFIAAVRGTDNKPLDNVQVDFGIADSLFVAIGMRVVLMD